MVVLPLSKLFVLNVEKLAEWLLSNRFPSSSSTILKVTLPIVTDKSILPGFIFSPNKSLPTLMIEADVFRFLLDIPGL